MKALRLLNNIYFNNDIFFLILFVTARCNARCKMCFNWDNMGSERFKEELTLREIEKISTNINSLQQLTISGGEPFLRSDLSEICSVFNRNSNVQFITIPTNGLLPENIEKILTDALKANNNVHFRIGLSMSEIQTDLDDLFGVENAFYRQQETYKILKCLKNKYKNINIDAGIVINKYNNDRIIRIIEYIKNNMEDCNPIVSLVRGEPRVKDTKNVDIEDVEKIYRYCRENNTKIKNRQFADVMNIMRDMLHEITIEMLKEGKAKIPCQCGKKMIVIYDNGDVYPCELLDNKLGNVREYEYDIYKIIGKKENKMIINSIIENKCYCTWECALNNNIVFSNKCNLELLKRYIKSKIGLYV